MQCKKFALRVFSTATFLAMVTSCVTGAFAEMYNIASGSITVNATTNGDGSSVRTVTQNGEEHTETGETVITGTSDKNTVTINADKDETAEVTLKDLNITSNSSSPVDVQGEGSTVIEIDGSVTLDASGSGLTNGSAALHKGEEGTLEITDEDHPGKDPDTQDTLTATAGGAAAAIGSNSGENEVGITISGGKITATGVKNAEGEIHSSAGIGSGEGGTAEVTIKGNANITAYGGAGAAAIGSGTWGVANVTITEDATIEKAVGGGTGGGGAGIGSGAQAYSVKDGETTVTISGSANVKSASSVYYGAGIGSGMCSYAKTTVTIADSATVNATGGKGKSSGAGAGIGTGGASACETVITITDSATVDATGGNGGVGTESGNTYITGGGAGIGNGANNNTITSTTTVNIATDKTVTATGGTGADYNGQTSTGAAAIGAGGVDAIITGTSGTITVNINGGTVNAYAGEGTAIGSETATVTIDPTVSAVEVVAVAADASTEAIQRSNTGDTLLASNTNAGLINLMHKNADEAYKTIHNAQYVSDHGQVLTTENYLTGDQKTAHAWQLDEQKTTRNTCAAGGHYYYTCSICGATADATVDADASKHTYGAPEFAWSGNHVTGTVTCTTEGCTGTSHTASGEANGTYVPDSAATCTANETGHYTATVTINGKEYTATGATFEKEGTAKGHTYGEWTVADGVRTRTCTVCSDTQTEKVAEPEENTDTAQTDESYTTYLMVMDVARRDVTADAKVVTMAQVDDVLYITAGGEETAYLEGHIEELAKLYAQGVRTIVFVTNGRTTTVTLAEILAKGKGEEIFHLAHTGSEASLTVAGIACDYMMR